MRISLRNTCHKVLGQISQIEMGQSHFLPFNNKIEKYAFNQIEFYRGQAVTPGDRYLAVMREFMAMASVRLGELEDLFTDMKARLDFRKKDKNKNYCDCLFTI